MNLSCQLLAVTFVLRLSYLLYKSSYNVSRKSLRKYNAYTCENDTKENEYRPERCVWRVKRGCCVTLPEDTSTCNLPFSTRIKLFLRIVQKLEELNYSRRWCDITVELFASVKTTPTSRLDFKQQKSNTASLKKLYWEKFSKYISISGCIHIDQKTRRSEIKFVVIHHLELQNISQCQFEDIRLSRPIGGGNKN